MPWLQKNLGMVLSGVVALALLGGAGYFLYNNMTLETSVTQKLTEQANTLQSLANKHPNPGDGKINNIKAAQEQNKQLEQFVAKVKQVFPPMNYPTNEDGGQFKLTLAQAVADLQRDARDNNVAIPQDYAFTFGNELSTVSFDPKDVRPLSMALTDISAISRILFNAKVLSLESIRRVAVASQDKSSSSLNNVTPTNPVGGGGDDFWDKKPITNSVAVIVPYEFTFHGFTAELGNVLYGLYRSPHCYLVKNLWVDNQESPLLQATPANLNPGYPMPGVPQGHVYHSEMSPSLRARYGMAARYGLANRYNMASRYGLNSTPGMAPVPQNGIILEPHPCRIVLWVDVVRFGEPSVGSPPGTRVPSSYRPMRRGGSAATPAVSAQNN